jgi:hypothetical protein
MWPDKVERNSTKKSIWHVKNSKTGVDTCPTKVNAGDEEIIY